MTLLDALLAKLEASLDLSAVHVVEEEIIDADTYQFKVRAIVKSAAFQIRVLRDGAFARYSFQLYTTRSLLRWDNTPHFPNLPNFPHHFHDVGNKVSTSSLTGDLLTDVDTVLAEIVRFVASGGIL